MTHPAIRAAAEALSDFQAAIEPIAARPGPYGTTVSVTPVEARALVAVLRDNAADRAEPEAELIQWLRDNSIVAPKLREAYEFYQKHYQAPAVSQEAMERVIFAGNDLIDGIVLLKFERFLPALVERLRAALRLVAPVAEQGWRSMDTAPKDGRKILAYHSGFGTGALVLYFADGMWREPKDGAGFKLELDCWMPIPALVPAPPVVADMPDHWYPLVATPPAAADQAWIAEVMRLAEAWVSEARHLGELRSAGMEVSADSQEADVARAKSALRTYLSEIDRLAHRAEGEPRAMYPDDGGLKEPVRTLEGQLRKARAAISAITGEKA